jgi:hypothetical protein
MKRKRLNFLFLITLFSGLIWGCQVAPKDETKPTPFTLDAKPLLTDPEGVLLGVYPGGFLQYRIQEIRLFDEWIKPTGKRVSIAATFIDFEDPDPVRRVPAEMEAAWEFGYIPFVNLSVGNLEVSRTAEEIAAGELDQEIRAFAKAYARWSKEGEKRAFIAPLQEMNGYWTSYGEDPENFKAAYRRIRYLFSEEGVPERAVSWVFSPNGWSAEGHEFEIYYPGDELVDVIGFNSFNFGACSTWPKWEGYPDIFLPYLERLSVMAPDKPIFVSSLGTVAEGGDKNQWLEETYTELADYPNLRAILYFNRGEVRNTLPHCPEGTDYRIFYPDTGEGYPSFLEVISSVKFTYFSPDSPEIGELMFTRP